MKTDELQNTIQELLTKAGFEPEEINSSVAEEDGSLWFAATVKDSHLFTGRNGEALMALNHIVKKIIDTRIAAVPESVIPEITIDINDFQKRKNESLKTVAHMMAERARFFKASVDIDPMSAYERKVIHTFLQNSPNIKTESVGEGRDRHIVIRYIEAENI